MVFSVQKPFPKAALAPAARGRGRSFLKCLIFNTESTSVILSEASAKSKNLKPYKSLYGRDTDFVS